MPFAVLFGTFAYSFTLLVIGPHKRRHEQAVGCRARSRELGGTRNGRTADTAAAPRNLTRAAFAPLARNSTDDSVVSRVGSEIISFPVGSQFAYGLSEQHIDTQIGNAQHYGVGTVCTSSHSPCAPRKRAHLFRACAQPYDCSQVVRDFAAPVEPCVTALGQQTAHAMFGCSSFASRSRSCATRAAGCNGGPDLQGCSRARATNDSIRV